MAILEKELWITLSNKEISYYENLGYEIPRQINKLGNFITPRGTKIKIKVEHLQPNSNKKVTKVCDECGKISSHMKYQSIMISRKNGDGKDRCVKCGTKKGGATQKSNVPLDKTMEYFALNNGRTILLEEFSDKNTKSPANISFGSDDIYSWNCNKCSSEFSMSSYSRTIANCNCPYCVGQKVNHTNCLWTTHPEIAELLKNPQRGYEITAGSRKKEYFVCGNCFKVNKKTVYHVTERGLCCSRCSDGISYPEKIMISVLEQLNVTFEREVVFDWSKNFNCENEKLNGSKRYDFYLPELGCIIEMQGRQHSEETTFTYRSLKEEVENDQIKKNLALKNNIDNYITIDCKISEVDYIKINIISSKLKKLVNLDEIDWLKCHEFACNSLVKVACEHWNEGIKNTKKISELLKLSRTTIINYLKQGVKVGWCEYNAKEIMKNNGKTNGGINSRKVIQLTLKNEFIKEWESGRKAAKFYDIANKIPEVCKGKRKKTGGYKWMYKEDYDKYIAQDKKELIHT